MAVLAVLAALQYHWLGQVNQAERQRMHETMTARARSLANDIDREVSRLYVTFQLREPDTRRFEQAIAERYKVWRDGARHPDLVTGVYAVSSDSAIQRFDPQTGTLASIEWPDSLKNIRERMRTSRLQTSGAGLATFTFRMPQPVSADPLAIPIVM